MDRIDEKNSKIGKQITGSFGEDLRFELRKRIFGSRQGECLTQKELQDLYKVAQPDDSLNRQTVAHIVSCQKCLDAVKGPNHKRPEEIRVFFFKNG